MSATRSRRTTAKAVNYAKVQEFSDQDMFESSEDEVETKRRGRPRKKSVQPSSGAATGNDDDQMFDNKPVYTEKGYDPYQLPLRERFPFLPEYEEDGSPKIELIVGRRPIDEKEDDVEEASDKEEEAHTPPTRRSDKKKKKDSPANSVVEYEYLIKYKGRSYLHLEWKSGADLESMNKSAKGIYRRYLKKLNNTGDEELESPEFDPSYAIPEKIVDEAEQEITVEYTDKELLKWEKEREKEMAEQDDDEDDEEEDDKEEEKKDDGQEVDDDDAMDEDITWPDEIDFKALDLEFLRKVLKTEGSYYPVVKGSDNPYRDGYVTEPPKKPRASYLFFQSCIRPYFLEKYPNKSQADLMALLGETWRGMDDEDKVHYQILADEESKEFDRQHAMLEKAQKPNGVWQPIRRCKEVLERLASDSFADIFLEPVDLEEFPDYEDTVEVVMDLGTVRQRLENKKYQAPEQFARDMRRVWNNCKIYNQHGSAIWHVGDYMSKQFERLYHAWVLEFRERYLRWADPRARPWEHSCRIHDGKCGTPDDKMVLCDHCDGMYGIQCLKPPLKKVPTKAWHCPDCKPKLRSAKGTRMLSAVAENAARKRAELGDLPKKKVTQVMYLVKWSGLGYEFCTWETKEDVANDKLISIFRKLETGYSDEADMPEATVKEFLGKVKHVNPENAGGIGIIPEIRTQLYAQTRSMEFMKFGMEIPTSVSSYAGPKMSSLQPDTKDEHPREVLECLADLVARTTRRMRSKSTRAHTFLPLPLSGEYDTIVPITANGLMMNVGEIHGAVAFLGYRKYPDGSPGPSEISNVVRSVGDKIIAVDGVSTVGKSFKEVIDLLKESGKNKFAYMRFLESRFSLCDGELASVGRKGVYLQEELRQKLSADRRRLLVNRKANIDDDVKDQDDADEDSIKSNASDAEEEVGSEGSFEPESDDEELLDTVNVAEVSPSANKEMGLKDPEAGSDPANPAASEEPGLDKSPEKVALGSDAHELDEGVLCREETTRSLGLRLLDVDLGYSSDEAGDEDGAFFLDGVDDTFTSTASLEEYKKPENRKKVTLIPASASEFTSLGERGKLTAAVAMTSDVPSPEAFETFPEVPETAVAESPVPKTTKRSTVKVEQINASTGETVHVWANIESASATLQLPLPALQQMLRGEYDEDVGEDIGGFKWRYALAGSKVTAGETHTSRGGGGKKAKEAWLEFRDKLYDPSEPHSYKNGNRLRDYQVDGVNWLASTWYKRHGCILADEMGLGKTVQIVCYIEHLYRVEKIHRPFLVVVPLSTVEHWRREFEGWTDMVCCVYHDRQRVWRDILREYEWYYKDRPHTPEFLKFDVLVTTYDTLIGDFDVVSQIPFRVAVVDEAHRLRNQKGKLLECMREISAKGTMQYGFQSRVLMSGTPLQNDLTELWTLLNFIEPFKFPDLDVFEQNFGNMRNRSQVEALQQMISPFMLRRVKEDVAKDIPAKEETVIDVELTSIQKQYYRAIFEHNHAFLNIGGTRQSAPKLMNIQMELRKVCNHPFLLEGVEHRETDRQFREFLDNGKFDGKTPEQQQHMLNEHGYIMTSGKMVLMDKLLPKLRQEGHKILIFSQMVKMIDLISEYCEFRQFNYERLDGRVRGSERQKAIDRFEREKDSFLFLLSTRAGGVGINLTAADICIIFDSDWNPQNDVQAQARCHRIGQTKDVRIYRLVTSRSFEQEMFDRASKKLGLEQAVLGTFEKDKEDDKPSQQEMEQLLKKGAYALLEDDNDEVTKEFCADDIESILAKRTRTRVVEGTKTASWLNKQGMVVSKSKFTSESGEKLDMDDPLFWQKVMPDFVTPALMLQKLRDLEDEIEGKKRGPGRGRGRWRKKREEEAKAAAEAAKLNGEKNGDGDEKKDAADVEKKETPVDKESPDDKGPDSETKEDNGEQNETKVAMNGDKDQPKGPESDKNDEPDDEEESGDDDSDKKSKTLTRTSALKINKFIGDLKSMMESVFDDMEEEGGLSSDAKDDCQKLLLTISVREKYFNEQQRLLAKKYLKRIEGDRRRRCRVSESSRFQPGADDEVSTPAVREELMIRGTKRKKRRKRGEPEVATPKKKRRSADNNGILDEDGYLRHSDSEGEWSDVGDDIYSGTSKDTISRKEANRRRLWAAGDDAATAAGRAWPVFPRHSVRKVLGTVLEKVAKYDEEKGGVFSVPVPEDEFPEYYEQIKKPMDYGTMQEKLENGEYRSAQAMQKDFILIMQNCRQFNADNSDIVREAREQHLMRPKFLKEAAAEHNMFLGEDGSVLEIVEDSPKKKKKKGGEKTKSGKKTKKKDGKKRKGKGGGSSDEEGSDDGEKPRIRIKLKAGKKKGADKSTKRKRGDEASDAGDSDGGESSEPIPKKKQKIDGTPKKKSKKSKTAEASNDAVAVSGKTDDDSDSVFCDVDAWKKFRGELDGSFKSARKNLMRHGAWKLPTNVADKFSDIALFVLSKMNEQDKYSVFEKEVTDEEAPGYSEVVKFPMDFGKMRAKVKKGEYGTGSDATAGLYKDFKQVFDNCFLYNDEDSEVTEEASRILGYLPEIYAEACVKFSK